MILWYVAGAALLALFVFRRLALFSLGIVAICGCCIFLMVTHGPLAAVTYLTDGALAVSIFIVVGLSLLAASKLTQSMGSISRAKFVAAKHTP